MSVQVVILAGGLGTRLGALTRNLPKALIEVAGRPFIDWQLEHLKAGGATDIVLCIGHRAEQIADHVGDGHRHGLRVVYSREGASLLGTGGAVRLALPHLAPEFVLTYGDSYLALTPAEAVRALRHAGTAALMSVLANPRDEPSNAALRGPLVIRYAKKNRDAEMTHIDYGMLAFRRETVAAWQADTAFDLEVPLGELAARNELAALEVHERYYEVGSVQGLADLAKYLSGAK
jgi:NDP-sugar pyrophosphorylase family protein